MQALPPSGHARAAVREEIVSAESFRSCIALLGVGLLAANFFIGVAIIDISHDVRKLRETLEKKG